MVGCADERRSWGLHVARASPAYYSLARYLKRSVALVRIQFLSTSASERIRTFQLPSRDGPSLGPLRSSISPSALGVINSGP